MAAAEKAKGKGLGGLKKKVGPLPLWAWALLGAIALYVVWTKFLSGGAQQQQQQVAQNTTPDPATSGSGSGLGSSTGGVDTSQQGAQTIADALGASNQQLLGQIGQSNQDLLTAIEQDLSGFASGAGGAAAGAPGDYQGYIPPGSTATQPLQTGTTTHPVTYHPIAVHTANFGQAAQAQTTQLRQQGAPQPFGGVAHVARLANGSTVTTYANGRQVQQVPGKSAYVIRKGG